MSGLLPLVLHSLRRRRGFLAAAVVVLVGFQLFIITAARAIHLSGGFAQIQMFMPAFLKEWTNMVAPSFRGFVLFGYSHPLIELFLIAVAIGIATEPAAEIESKFVDLLMARPLRRAVVIHRTLAVLAVATVIAIGSIRFGTWIGLRFIAPSGVAVPSARVITSLAVNLAFLVLAWGGIAVMVASFCHRRTTAAATCGFLAFAMFVLDWVARLWEAVRGLNRLTPFHYFNPFSAFGGQALPLRDLVALAAIFVATSTVAYVVYGRRDL